MMARDDHVIGISEAKSFAARTIEVRKMLHGLQNAVLASPRTPRKHVPT